MIRGLRRLFPDVTVYDKIFVPTDVSVKEKTVLNLPPFDPGYSFIVSLIKK